MQVEQVSCQSVSYHMGEGVETPQVLFHAAFAYFSTEAYSLQPTELCAIANPAAPDSLHDSSSAHQSKLVM